MAMNYMALAVETMHGKEDAPDPPVGALLRIGNHVQGVDCNRIVTRKSLLAHAESSLLFAHSESLFRAFLQKPRQEVVIYTTLEPCLLCTAAAAHSRVSRIVYACRDPMAGCAAHVPPDGWYRSVWPALEHDPAYEAEVAHAIYKRMGGRGPLAAAVKHLF